MNRRDALRSLAAGGAAGAIMAAGVAVAEVVAVRPLAELVSRYRLADEAYCECCDADDLAGMPEPSADSETAWKALWQARMDLLEHRPSTVSEVGDLLEFLWGHGGPFEASVPSPEEVAFLVASMRRAA